MCGPQHEDLAGVKWSMVNISLGQRPLSSNVYGNWCKYVRRIGIHTSYYQIKFEGLAPKSCGMDAQQFGKKGRNGGRPIKHDFVLKL